MAPLAVVPGREAPLGVEIDAVVVRFHRMSSPCARGATASGGVTFMRAASFLIPNTCFIAFLLFDWINFHADLSASSGQRGYRE